MRGHSQIRAHIWSLAFPLPPFFSPSLPQYSPGINSLMGPGHFLEAKHRKESDPDVQGLEGLALVSRLSLPASLSGLPFPPPGSL